MHSTMIQKSQPYTLEVHLANDSGYDLPLFDSKYLVNKDYGQLNSSSDYYLNRMGMAVVDAETKDTNFYKSDNQETHAQEAKNMEETFTNYLSSEEGENFLNYVSSRGKKMMDIKGVGACDLGENTVAAILHNGIEGIILSNYEGKSFGERVSGYADLYGIDNNSAEEYVLAHELSHAAGHNTEESAEEFLEDYFTEMAEKCDGDDRSKYQSLAKVACQRKEEAGAYESGNEYREAA